jgi:hypothetical protein
MSRPVTDSQKVICVLGMHRSGTSCLTGTLEEAGVFLGAVSRKNPHNLKGNHESDAIVALHEDVLRENGAAWDAPRRDVAWSTAHRRRRDEIIALHRHAPRWGFKDPRTLLVLDGWLEALPDLTLVGVFRDPLLVARSLQARNGMSLECGVELWVEYNERLLRYWRARRFPILSFDSDDDSFRAKTSALLALLGLARAPGELRFFEPSLRHNEAVEDAGGIGDRAAEMLATLRGIAL